MLYLLIKKHSKPQDHPFPCTGPHGPSVIDYGSEDNQQETLHKFAIILVTHCESEPWQ